MRSKKYRRGTKAYRKAGRRSLSWYTERYGTSGKRIYERGSDK